MLQLTLKNRYCGIVTTETGEEFVVRTSLNKPRNGEIKSVMYVYVNEIEELKHYGFKGPKTLIQKWIPLNPDKTIWTGSNINDCTNFAGPSFNGFTEFFQYRGKSSHTEVDESSTNFIDISEIVFNN